MTIHPGQLGLLVALCGFALYALRLRTVLFDRVIFLGLMLLGTTFVIRPDITSWLASRAGIGRGSDLLFYMFIIFCLFNFLSIASQMKKLERQVTILARKQAIAEATPNGVAYSEERGSTSPSAARESSEELSAV